ncbi:divergent protein kinase domain 2A-like isoform X2 [Bacillus rossius redtenbacheri]
MLRRLLRKAPRMTWRLLALLLVTCAVLGWWFAGYLLVAPGAGELTEVHKCPSCYGVTACPAFMLGQVELTGASRLVRLLDLVGGRNVMFATHGDRRVVLKRLGNRRELAELDARICREMGRRPGCRVGDAMWKVKDVRSLIASLLDMPDVSPNSSDSYRSLHLCPSTTNVDLFLEKIFLRYRAIGREILYTNIWTMLLINPEPIILQVLPAEEGWPVPRYLGACGRIAVQEYAGDMLTSHHGAPWLSRASMAYQLLSAAEQFTSGHPHFRFYLTDVSPDNIAVDPAGVVRFVDLENVVVLDKAAGVNGELKMWDRRHTSEHIECEGCFAFSVQDLCSHHVSDHNFYAVCQELLLPAGASPGVMPGGLLHDVPPHVLASHPQLPRLIEHCARPPPHLDRATAAHNLARLLANITAQS